MALQIKGKFIEASTLDGDRVLLKWDGQTPSKGGALRFQKSAANGGGIVELISYDETSGKAIFKSGSTTEEYIFKSEILESTGADAGKLKVSLMPSDVMLESEFLVDGKIPASKLEADVLIASEVYSASGKIPASDLASEVLVESEILENDKIKASLLPDIPEANLPSNVMLESEFTTAGLINDNKIAASIARDSEVLLKSDYLNVAGDKIKAEKLEIPSDVVTETELYNTGTEVIKDAHIPSTLAKTADVLTKADYVDGSGIILDTKLPSGLTRDSEVFDGSVLKSSIIPDSVMLESEFLVDGKFDPSKLPALAITSVSVVASDAERDALIAQEGDVAVVTESNKSYIRDSSGTWQELKTPGQVSSVNGQTGTVILTTTHIAEGSNEYFTEARAQSAAVRSNIAANDESRAPASKAVYDALAGKANSSHTHVAADITDFSTSAKSAVVVNSSAGSETDQAMSVSAAKSYAETQAAGKVEDAIVDGVTTKAPSQNAVYDALELKYDAADFNGDFDDRLATKDTDDVAEGGANKYFTDARAQTAAVGDAIAEGVTTKAPSQNAVFNALALKASKSALNTAINALHVKESPITISATPEQEFDLAHKPAASSVMVSVGRLLLQEGTDYEVSEVSGSWKVVLKAGGPVASGGEEALEAGDKVFIKYMKEIALA